MGRKGRGAPQVQQTHTSNAPWGPQAAQLIALYDKAARLSETVPQFFPGQTYVPYSAETEEALAGITNRARAGSPLNRAAQASVLDMLRPDFATNNPVYRAALNANLSQLLPQVQSQFALSGGARSGMARAAEQQMASNVAGNLGLQFMQMQERAREFAPRLANEDYTGFERLGQVGGAREEAAMMPIREAMARHEFEQNKRRQQLYDLAAMVTGGTGTESTGTVSQSPYRGSRLGGALGGGLGGMAMGAMAGFNPVVGGLLGGIGGLF